jgi:adenylate cyclase
MEEHADAMSSAAQILLHTVPTDVELPMWHRDVERIRQAALGIYRLVRERLAVEHFLEPHLVSGEELQGLRHELRGFLQNILGRCQLVLEEEEQPETVRCELTSIMEHAHACVIVLDRSRDYTPPGRGIDLAVNPFTAKLTLPADEDEEGTREPVAGGTILVADDSAGSREVLGRFLTGQGHEVVFASTGKEALARVDEMDFDLILLDLVMPELNGFEVLRGLRQRKKLRYTFVIIISGLDANANAIRGIEMGAVDFLARPIDLRLLRARVNACLERQRLRERELAQYFTPELARHLHRHPEQLAAGRRVEVSVLFCDIAGFSRVSERLGPDRTIRWLSDVLETMSACIMEEEGVLVDFTGDQVMALWGAPHEQMDHADRACRTALAMQTALPELNEKWQEEIGHPTEISVGINTGDAYVGNIGTPQKFKYGALGNTVNLASRIQGACKYARARMLATSNTIDRLTAPIFSRRLGQIRVNNINAPVYIHELEGVDETDPWHRLRTEYESALHLFETEEFRKASSLLGQLLDDYPDDGPSLLLMSRVVDALLKNDAKEFDPVWELPGK